MSVPTRNEYVSISNITKILIEVEYQKIELTIEQARDLQKQLESFLPQYGR